MSNIPSKDVVNPMGNDLDINRLRAYAQSSDYTTRSITIYTDIRCMAVELLRLRSSRVETTVRHDVTCNYPRGPLYGPGCICMVVNKHVYARLEAAAVCSSVEPQARNGAICPDGLGECDRHCKVNCARVIERDAMKPTGPESLVGALQDRVHKEIGVTRAAHAVKATTPIDREAVNALALECAQASAVVRRSKFTGQDFAGAECKHCRRARREHGPSYECPPLNGPGDV